MTKYLIGTVNQYGREALCGCFTAGNIIFEPKDFISGRDGKFLKYVTWSAWLVDHADNGPRSREAYKGNNEYMGD